MLPDDTPEGGGLYIIWLSDTHYYGGSTLNFSSRWRGHLAKLQKGNHGNIYMQRVFNKYGRFEPRVIQCLPHDEARDAEQEWLDEHLNRTGCMNISPFARGGAAGLSEETRKLISSQQVGRVWINNGKRNQRVYPEEAEALTKEGWVRGQKESPNSVKGMVTITDGENQKRVRPHELESYLSKGWRRGAKPSDKHSGWFWMNRDGVNKRVRSDEEAELLANGWVHGFLKPENKPEFTGRVWVNNGKTNKKVHPDDVASWLERGWSSGLLKKGKSSGSGRVWLKRDGKRRRVLPEQVDELLADGWTRGMGELQSQ